MYACPRDNDGGGNSGNPRCRICGGDGSLHTPRPVTIVRAAAYWVKPLGWWNRQINLCQALSLTVETYTEKHQSKADETKAYVVATMPHLGEPGIQKCRVYETPWFTHRDGHDARRNSETLANQEIERIAEAMNQGL